MRSWSPGVGGDGVGGDEVGWFGGWEAGDQAR